MRHRAGESLLCSLIISILALTAAGQANIRHPYASDKPITEATIFGEGIVSTRWHEDSPGFSRDGRTLYWEFGLPILSTIVLSRFENGKWSEPEMAHFSGRYHDRDPYISPDGSTLIFVSTRGAADSLPEKRLTYRELERMLDNTRNGLGDLYKVDARVLKR